MQKEAGETQPSLRLCEVERPSTGSCGFHLTRTAWDPYPWVSGVEAGSAAEAAGLQSGDCVLEVNGEDVLGQRIGEVASRVRARGDRVTLLLWNAGSDPHTAATSISGNGTTPVSLQRLSGCLQSVLQLLECPVCLETVPPPAFQCCNGHVLCGGCRARADRCPVCRVGLGPRGRCLLADKLHNLLTTTLNRYNQTKQKNTTNKKSNSIQPQHQPPLYLKSRILTDIRDVLSSVQGTTEMNGSQNPDAQLLQVILQTKARAVLSPGASNEDSSTQEYSDVSSEHSQDQQTQQKASSSENVYPGHCATIGNSSELSQKDATLQTSRALIQPKASSVENISACSKQPSRRVSEQMLSTSAVEEATTSPLRARSLSAGQIPTRNRNESPLLHFTEKQFCNESEEQLLLHCPFPMKSQPCCRSILNGPHMLIRHVRETHQGPLVQYFVDPSCSGVTLRLPLSGSKKASSSLMSFSTKSDVMFFVQVAAGATPGHRLVWLWLLGDAVQAERYRLRLTLPEGDTHTGPVFPLTASWSDVVNSNCCLSFEEGRYLRGNPQVQLEILDVAKSD